MSGSRWGRSPRVRRGAQARADADAETPASPWDALERRARGPRRVPLLLLAVLAVAGLVIGVAVGAGTPLVSHGGLVAIAEDDEGSGSDSDSEGSEESGNSESDSGESAAGGSDSEDSDSGSDSEGSGEDSGSGSGSGDGSGQEGGQDEEQGGGGRAGGQGGGGAGGEDAEQFPNRDKAGRPSAEEFVNIQNVRSVGRRGEGGVFSGGSYSIRCAMSAHHNSDNFIIAPGKRNGAQHTHDYAGNEGTNFASEDQTLEESSTTCTNGDRSPIFWPVLRDLRGVGPDVGADGGSLDGNVGSFIEPSSVDFTFHGHGTRRTEAMPLNIALVTGSAKAATTGGEGSNAKFTCTGSGQRMTDLYPMCPDGSSLQRVYDFPSCWNGQDLDSEDHATHIRYPDENGECDEDLIPVPALRITVTYEDPPPGRQFAIDSFPEQRHNPITDHALLEYLSSERRAEEGADCINAARRCVQGPAQDAAAAGSTDIADRVPGSRTFVHALATHANAHQPRTAVPAHDGTAHDGPVSGPRHAAPEQRPSAPRLPAPARGLGPLPGVTPLPRSAPQIAPLRTPFLRGA
ncbi:DUF1996 domain-containing protein [Actinomycetospora chibensis]|uniref:DUF1996 domain-containing protein n=1 Tax=Actinomycetospora chibensis TaxID=663606 RepID=A0ABV9RJB3_9PSEU|nr:DUF1996 domain-containing protein [Actinomycetospora chibensis]MDD7924536.1 DUF1996 domain-containing protein [Actinomycetospora chibensis]